MENVNTKEAVLERILIRETLEKYLGCLDDKDWDGIASCFTDNAVAYYNNDPETLRGGQGVAQWLHRMVIYNATNHALSNLRTQVDGDQAIAHSLVIATLHQGQEGKGRTQVRGIDYMDNLIRVGDEWKITKRIHRPTMQYDALSQTRVLYKNGSCDMV